MTKQFYVYILASKRNGTLYIGVTSDLIKRIWQHRGKFVEGFCEKYSVDILVHYEIFNDPVTAVQREKNLKRWIRQWKVELIEKNNPDWKDLYPDLMGGGSSGHARG